MTACAPMQELGRVDGVTWYWAEPGRFSEPGVYYWNGKENVRVIAALAGEPAVAADEGRNPPGFVKPDNARQVFFYEQDFYVLSNFSAFNLRIRGMVFPTSEHAYHYAKFDDKVLLDAIQAAPSAHEAFKIAERNKHRRCAEWDEIKVAVMREILRAKVAQHEYVRRKLLATGDRELIEDSWRDDFWGWGPNRNGQNMLGKLWMEIRSELRAASQDEQQEKQG